MVLHNMFALRHGVHGVLSEIAVCIHIAFTVPSAMYNNSHFLQNILCEWIKVMCLNACGT